jgi:hypothetical protein
VHHASAQTSPGGTTTAPDTTDPNTIEETTPTVDVQQMFSPTMGLNSKLSLFREGFLEGWGVTLYPFSFGSPSFKSFMMLDNREVFFLLPSY